MTRSRTLVTAIGLFALTLLTPTGAQATLVAHWPFDTLAGGTTPELVAGNNGTAVGNPVLSPGVFGNALDFDGDDYLTHMFAVNRSAFTIAHWLRPQGISTRNGAIAHYESDGTGANYNGFDVPAPALEMHSGLSTIGASNDTVNYPHLVGQPTAAARWWFMLQDGSNGPAPNAALANSVKLIGGEAVEDAWKHVAVTKTAAGVFTLYENGVAVHSVDAGLLGITFNGILATTKNIGIHGDAGTNNRYWTGLMDDLAIYDAALSASAIQNLMANGVPEPSSVMLAFVALGALAYRKAR